MDKLLKELTKIFLFIGHQDAYLNLSTEVCKLGVMVYIDGIQDSICVFHTMRLLELHCCKYL